MRDGSLAQPPESASASSSLTKLESDITQGAPSPCGPPGRDTARGAYCGVSTSRAG